MLETGDWVSVHAFDHAGSRPLIPQVLGPWLRSKRRDGSVRAAFYLHHWAGGPHLRIRLLPAEPGHHAALQAELMAVLAPLLQRSAPGLSPQEYARRAAPGQLLEGSLPLPALQPDGTAQAVPIELDWPRFGGPERAAATVEVFDTSSRWAARALEAGLSTPQRVSLALQTCLLTLRPLLRQTPEPLGALAQTSAFWSSVLADRQAEFHRWVERGCRATLPRLTALVTGADEPAAHPHARRVAEAITHHRAAFAPVPHRPSSSAADLQLAADLLHLHHNRLGLHLLHEAQLWRTVLFTARHCGGRYAA